MAAPHFSQSIKRPPFLEFSKLTAARLLRLILFYKFNALLSIRPAKPDRKIEQQNGWLDLLPILPRWAKTVPLQALPERPFPEPRDSGMKRLRTDSIARAGRSFCSTLIVPISTRQAGPC
jgi:hypothetical protein